MGTKEQVLIILSNILNKDLFVYDDEKVSPNFIEEWDSLVHLDLIASLEEKYSIDISPDEINEMREGLVKILEIIRTHGIH